MKHFILAAMLGIACLAVMHDVTAKEKAEPVLTAQNKDAFQLQADGIRAQMAKGGRYQFVKDDEKRTVERNLTAIAGLFERNVGSQLNENEKIEMVNAQEEINAILTQRDSQRIVCERKAPTGSHLQQSTCRTYGQIEQERADTQYMLRQAGASREGIKGN